MESRTEGSNSEVTSRPEAVHSGSASTTDGIILPITGHKLNGQNFIQWAQSVRIFIYGKGKEEYLTGAIVQPKEDDPGYRTWKLENSMVMSWLINSMTNDIGENFMYYGTAKEIWDAARETYSNIDNTSAIFEIKSILQDLRQGDSTVTKYFNILTRYWQQLDIYEELVWKCPEDGLLYKKVIEKERIYKFLLGLNKNLDENSALVARGTQSNNNNHQTKKNRPWCDHCRKPGHTKETCWHLHGKPADWKPSRPQQNREEDTSGTISNPGPFSKEQLEALQKCSIDSSINWNNYWYPSVAQKGASDHMTGNVMVFHEYTPCHNNSSVRIADGTLSRGIRHRKRIGNAEVRAGLYLLRAEEIRRLPMKTACVVSNPSTKTDSVVMLWHYRLGENWSTDEFQFWETEISTTSPLSSSLPPQTDSTLSVPENNSLDVPSVTPESTTQGSKEVIVYSRKNLKEKPDKPPQKEPEDSTPPEQNQELDQDPSNPNSQPGNTIYDLDSSNDLDDLDQPIALRKGVRSCTQHLISNHVSYG
ncbi:hypothetical protein CK203_099976 [Vitis vinifera]|uniref:Uncharacterized protein n=1 Tax=Vitis vinifera TaxID=29760 RepID=A0A438CIQ0_VITVI|nr:hypothetical protein CK203_099976 [Vitis vinifera]